MPLRHFATSAVFMFAIAITGCDDKPKGDQKSVIEGGKAESAEGKKLENAKREIDGAEKALQDRADRDYEAAQDEPVQRGVP